MADIINTLKVGGKVYDLSAKYAETADSLVTSAELSWENLEGLTAASGDTAKTSGIMTPDQINALLNSKTGAINVYTTAADISEVSAGNTIYLIKDDSVTGADKYNEYIYSNGEVIKIGDTSVDLAEYAKTADVETMISDSIGSATSAEATSLWSEVTAYVDETVSTAVSAVESSASLWNQAYEAVDGAATTSAEMADEGNASALATVGAITGYVEDKISETIAETIEIASAVEGAAPSAIPNIGALTDYVEDKIEGLSGDYLEKSDVYVDNMMLVINNI